MNNVLLSMARILMLALMFERWKSIVKFDATIAVASMVFCWVDYTNYCIKNKLNRHFDKNIYLFNNQIDLR